jgi:dTDP-4-dehydrorhamnose 3,5-epimerase
MARFSFSSTGLAGLSVVERFPIEDERGFLARLFCVEEFGQAGWSGGIAQINQTLTRHRGTIRGLHFQYPPHTESKLVTCLRGEIFDVAVDIRRGSATFLQWEGVRLSAANRKSLLIPEGFAHGFQTLSDDVELVYLHNQRYVASAEGALNSHDPTLAIPWPEQVTAISPRDAMHPMLDSSFGGVIP